MTHPTMPLTTHLAKDRFSFESVCGATKLTTSTGSMRLVHSPRVADCAVCLGLAGGAR